MRKTIKVERLIEMVNKRNKLSTCSADMRHGWNSLLESILFECKRYRGFGYYSSENMVTGEKPGVDRSNPLSLEFPDPSRIFFY